MNPNQTVILNPRTKTTLDRLIGLNQAFELHAIGTTNHCPMALIALARMGATSIQLERFFERWTSEHGIKKHELAQELAFPSDYNWTTSLNQLPDFTRLSHWFLQRLQRESIHSVLGEVFQRVPFAPATSAFHSIIRLGYGLEQNYPSEVAAGLSSYVVGHLALPLPDESTVYAASVESGLSQLRSTFSGSSWSSAMITERLRKIAHDIRFRSVLLRAPQYSANPKQFQIDLSVQAVRLYLTTKDFTILHMVTGTYAAKLIESKLEDHRLAWMIDSVWSAYCAAYVSVGAPDLNETQSFQGFDQKPNWAPLFEAVLESDNDHQVKMIYTCWHEFLNTKNLDYWYAAQLAFYG
jgi:hypothetical protein